MRHALCLSYDGADFCGWQIQPHSPSVQQCLEEALARLLPSPVRVTGAGRTDTGVHALAYVAHFDTGRPLPFGEEEFRCKLNAILPWNVTVHAIVSVPDSFHARFSAIRREYAYFLHRKKDPFLRGRSLLWHPAKLDFEAMSTASALLLGTHDFSCFEKVGGDNKTSICTVFAAGWQRCAPSPLPAGESWVFRIAADRFLRNMVRAIVGTLLEVGRGKRPPTWVGELLQSGTRGDAGESVPAHALYLTRIAYEPEIFRNFAPFGNLPQNMPWKTS